MRIMAANQHEEQKYPMPVRSKSRSRRQKAQLLRSYQQSPSSLFDIEFIKRMVG